MVGSAVGPSSAERSWRRLVSFFSHHPRAGFCGLCQHSFVTFTIADRHGTRRPAADPVICASAERCCASMLDMNKPMLYSIDSLRLLNPAYAVVGSQLEDLFPTTIISAHTLAHLTNDLAGFKDISISLPSFARTHCPAFYFVNSRHGRDYKTDSFERSATLQEGQPRRGHLSGNISTSTRVWNKSVSLPFAARR